MNNYFASVFVSDEHAAIPTFTSRSFDSPLTNIDISTKSVEDASDKLQPTNSPGPDGIRPMLIVNTKDVIKYHLATLFGQSLKDGTVPQDWKVANVTPILKKGPRSDPCNYRPISLTAVPCKLLQRIIRDALVKHMNSNNLFCKNQHGFRSGHSCTTQLLECLEDWTQAIYNGSTIDIIYLDFCKAFGKVSHRILLQKLDQYRIKGLVHKCIESFLVGAKQRVVINGSSSNSKPVTSGVPQSSVLGPILFLIYVNDIPEMVRCTVKLFADDTKLYSETHNQEDQTTLQSDINNIVDWTDCWLMKLNLSKCKHMEIGIVTNNTQFSLDKGFTSKQKVNTENDLD